MQKYGVKITYSWGDEEPTIICDSKDTAWAKAKLMAVNEAEITSGEHECEIGLYFNEDDGKIILHYTYDNEYCYYTLVKINSANFDLDDLEG